MSQNSPHQTSIVITPNLLKEQIIIRLKTLLSKVNHKYYFTSEDGNSKPVVDIEGVEVYGLETQNGDVYLMTVNLDDEWNDEDFVPYNAKEFYIEHLWSVYLACEPIYQSKFVDYGSVQD